MGHKQIIVQPESQGLMPPPIYKFLRADDTDQSADVIGDFSSTPKDFFYEAPEPGARIERLLVEIVDNGIIGVASYGAIMGGLSNGMELRVIRDGSTILDLMDGMRVQTNMNWALFCYDVSINDFGAGNDGYISVRWTFSRSGRPLRLAVGDRLVVTAQDDLSGLSEHRFQIQGFEEVR